MSKFWSASRLKTYHSCKLKYYYSYVDPYDSNQPSNAELANKGQCFHKTAEQMESGKSSEEMHHILESKVKEYKVDTSVYPEDDAFNRFILFWNEFVTKKEAEGFKAYKEANITGEIQGEKFTGYLDLHLVKMNEAGTEPEKVVIWDYKTATSASAASYKDQVVLYAYLYGLQYGWDAQTIKDKIDCFIFFPFADVNKNLKKPKTDPMDIMLSSAKRVNYTAEDVNNIISGFIKDIKEIHETEWNNLDVNLLAEENFTCRFCPFLGSLPDSSNGFKGCALSYKQGYRQLRGLKFSPRYPKK